MEVPASSKEVDKSAPATAASADGGEEEDPATLAAKKAAANKRKRDKKKAKAAEKALFGYDPAVTALASDFEGLSVHRFFSGNMALKYNKTQGRYVVASQDLPAGTVVLDQVPYAGVVVDQYVASICHQCFSSCSSLVIVCSGCKFARYCSKTCMRAHIAHPLECSTLQKFQEIPFEGESAPIRVIIRAMNLAHMEQLAVEDEKRKLSQRNAALREWRPKVGHNYADVDALMTHQDKFSSEHKQAVLHVMDRLTSIMPEAIWNQDGPQRALGLYLRTKVNAHHILDHNKTIIGLGLYTAASYVNHSCDPTCVLHFGPTGAMVMRTLREVKAGEELSYSYIDLYASSYERRKTLKERYFFDPIGGPRFSNDVIAKEDAVTGGLKCLDCGKGCLNYHTLKAAQFAATATPTVAASSTSTSTSSAEGKDNASDDEDASPEGAESKQPKSPAPVAVTSETEVTCDSCGTKRLKVGQIDAWLNSIQLYFDTAISYLSQPVRPGQTSPAAAVGYLIEENIISLATGGSSSSSSSSSSTSSSSPDAAPVIASAASKAAAKLTMPNVPARDVAKLHVFHRILLNCYMAMIQVSRYTADFKGMLKYGQLNYASLTQVKLTDHPEAADVHITCGDAYAWMSGQNPDSDSLPAGVAAPPCPIADPKSQAAYKRLAGNEFRKAMVIRDTCFGPKHPLSKQSQRRFAKFEQYADKPEKKAAVPAQQQQQGKK